MQGFLFRLTSLLPLLIVLVAFSLICWGFSLIFYPVWPIVAGILLISLIIDSRF